ncbi:MAG: Ribonuclease P protein component [Haliscomenobacter sp.]|jgi:ribonuclease P protein component|nr:Ribonuclease P protein component [Haliscomenobacter sp.]
MPAFTFRPNERLKSRKIIGNLFKTGNSFGMYPLRAVWIEVEQLPDNCPFQMTVSVPKKRFPKAADRNRIRRQVREAFRLNKHLLQPTQTPPPKPIALMILYTGTDQLPYSTIEEAIIRLVKKLGRRR